MITTNFIRKIVRNHPDLKVKLKKAASKQTPFQYVYQTITMTILSAVALSFVVNVLVKQLLKDALRSGESFLLLEIFVFIVSLFIAGYIFNKLFSKIKKGTYIAIALTLMLGAFLIFGIFLAIISPNFLYINPIYWIFFVLNLVIGFLVTGGLFITIFITLGLIPILYRFWFSYIDVQIRREARQLDGDLLFVSEYFLVSLESGLPLGNSIQNLSKLKRPGGRFFKKVFTEFKTGKDLEQALDEGASNCASEQLKVLLKRLKDSMEIGIDLRTVLTSFISEASENKVLEIRSFSKKLNPLVMMYLLMGVVLPSLGVTFFILGATIINVTPTLLKWILVFIFLMMFAFQYLSYSGFKFSKATL